MQVSSGVSIQTGMKSTCYISPDRTRNMYILTALRIVKTYFVRTKAIAKEADHAPPQIVTVLKSYHLKPDVLSVSFASELSHGWCRHSDVLFH